MPQKSQYKPLQISNSANKEVDLSLEQIGKYQRPIWLDKLPEKIYSWIFQALNNLFTIYALICLVLLSSFGYKEGTRQKLRENAEQFGKSLRKSLENFLQPIITFLNMTASRFPNIHLIEGEDSKDKEELKSAADQYNMLRDNFRGLPSKEDEENRCHYKYKDLKRRATKGRYLWRFWDWAINKWCLGYGIYTKRILFTILFVIAAFGLLYYFSAGPSLIKNFNENFNPLYFSVITFITMGYGDYEPMGWLKYIVAVEGLLGLVLVAIFTVSFARKLIR